MSGYIYVKNWERFQHYKNRRPAWIKLHLDLQNNQEYLALSPSDRLLLQQVWMSCAEFGNGRVRADQRAIKARARLQQGSLGSIVRAGFIEVRASKALAEVLAPERETEQEVDKGLRIYKNHSRRGRETPVVEDRATRNSKHAATLAACRRLAHQYAEAGEPPERIREWLTNEYRHDPTIVTEALGAP